MTIPRLKDLARKQRAAIHAWCMYDWANSAYATNAVAVLPVYAVFLFKDALGDDAEFLGLRVTGSSLWAFAVAISTAIIAITTPVLGVIADRMPIKKLLLSIYTFCGSFFMVMAFFSAYSPHPWVWLFGSFFFANMGFAGAQVFYNALLPHVAPDNLLDDVSSRGYAYGYLGGGLLLLAHMAAIFLAADTDYADLVTRLAIASVGVWWFGWAIWTFVAVPEPRVANAVRGLGPISAVALAFSEFRRTLTELRKFRVVLLYLGAYLLFNDGIQTVLTISGAFAADTLGIPLVFNVGTVLIIQFVAVPGALAFGWLAARYSTKTALVASLGGWFIIIGFGISIAPLEPEEHGVFDYRLEYRSVDGLYEVTHAPEVSDTETAQSWQRDVGVIEEGDMLGTRRTERLLEGVGPSRDSTYSVSVRGGALDGETAVGRLHASRLGSGPVDWWPITVRKLLWKPLGLDAGFQWLFIGVFVGAIIGGSQALARSLFSQITPTSRSGEFFSFFGFMSRASAVFGPLIYVSVTSALDTRAAITSVALLILAGTVALRWVDVASGRATAAAEDARLRGADRAARTRS